MKVLDINLEQFETKKALIQKLKSMGLPTPKTEHYRYFGIKPIFDRDYEFIKPKVAKPAIADYIEIVDGTVTKAPKNIYIEMQKNPKIDDSHYDQVYYINHLLSDNIIHIEFEEECEVKIVQKFTLSNAFSPYRIKLSLAPNIKVKLVEEHLVLANESLYFYGYDIDIAQDAHLTFIQDRNSNFDEFALIAPHSIRCAKSSRLDLFTIDFGTAKTLHNYHITLDEYAEVDANHVIFASKEAKLGNTFHIENRGKESKTSQLSRNILKDKARGIFDGLLIVKNPAKYSSIYQDSKTILLNDGAYMVSKPQMEIYTEYILEATHGSTTGHIDEEALFYLRQRGIAEPLAKEMIVLSFLNEIFEKMQDDEIKQEFIKLYEEGQ
ncbi:Fe-S cluster assembly protein SufD [Nitratiruptor sp. YY08-26]|uniref:SufD family Fe-S cluster assembly protein n=1 Tax=unclassified Nitratiruptor TaxID=2624044 RepID=UPI001914DD01|nr:MULTISPECIES: SufD family Fe-S cluster assembly protein [unclassified Nitratiruptor]BCD62370.1 Fe-S cluster assembly protein SufD [Nitratiruptor sp. YY08-13]BCD66306.1 Fe-S cluster assembly protein SufD [Nitratiruptor sp. YY08-26]